MEFSGILAEPEGQSRTRPRHARLVVGASLAWAQFVSETWSARQGRLGAPQPD